MNDTVPSPTIMLARAFAAVLVDPDTHPTLRARAKYCIAELRDELPLDAARRLDGIEAEAVITAFAELDALSPSQSFDGERLLELRQTPSERPTISAGIGE